MYDVDVSALREWNKLDSDALQPGMELFVGPEEDEAADADEGDAFVYHVVQQGETLFGLSRRFGVETSQIMEWNEMETPALQIGQRLIVGTAGETEASQAVAEEAEAETEQDRAAIPPTGQQQEDPDSAAYAIEDDALEYKYYEVRSGDTLSSIARRFGMPLSRLRQMNELDGDALSIGQRLIVGQQEISSGITALEVESTAQGRFHTHEIQESDNINELLEQLMMDSIDFEVLNPGLSPASVSTGQQVVLLSPPTISRTNPYVREARQAAPNGDGNLMRATVYAAHERGRTTTTGELYNPDDLTAAHPSLPLGSVVFVENAALDRGIYVLINDRTSDSRLKLSHRAFEHLELSRSQTAEVLVHRNLDQ